MTVALGTNIANPISTALSQWPGFDTMGKLANYGKLGVTDPDAVIKALFANSEQGVFYDPSDLTTMFQDRLGSTPVTADGQTVGLILDKSKGLVIGSERMNVPTSGTVSGSWLISGSGVVTRNGSAVGQSSCGTVVAANIETTKTFLVSFTITDFSGDSLLLRVGGGTAYQVSGNGVFNARVFGGGGNSVIFAPWGGSAGQATITGLTVKELAGNHAVAPSDAARPLYKTDGTYHWLQFDGVDDSLSTAAINFTATDKIGLWLGVKKNNSTGSYIASLTQSPPAFDGSLAHYSNDSTTDQVYLRATTNAEYRTLTHASVPVTRVLCDLFDSQTSTQADRIITRQNGVVMSGLISGSTTVPGTFSNDSIYIASRGNVAAYFSGNIHSLIVRGALSTTQEITDTETWVNEKTGAY